MTYWEQCRLEVEWYEKHGKYPHRITTDSDGMRYVQSDWQWNQKTTHAKENIGRIMREYVVYKATGIKR